MPEEDFQLGEVAASISGTSLEHVCDQFPFCPAEATRYRNIDGKCNNPNAGRGAWGAAGSPMYVIVRGAEMSTSHSIFRDRMKFNKYLFSYLGNVCCHQATRMVFGDHGTVNQNASEFAFHINV